MYIPFYLLKNDSSEQFTILVPVKTIATQEQNGSILIKINEALQFELQKENLDEYYNILENLKG